MQKFWKSVKIWQSYREFRGGPFFETQCIYRFDPTSPDRRTKHKTLIQSGPTRHNPTHGSKRPIPTSSKTNYIMERSRRKLKTESRVSAYSYTASYGKGTAAIGVVCRTGFRAKIFRRVGLSSTKKCYEAHLCSQWPENASVFELGGGNPPSARKVRLRKKLHIYE